jgi:hypothetical protein
MSINGFTAFELTRAMDILAPRKKIGVDILAPTS